MSELPESWLVATLEDVGVITTGGTPSKKENPLYFGGNYPFVKPGDLNSNIPITSSVEYLSDIGIQRARKLRSGAILVSCIGNLGRVAIAGTELATNQQINSIEFHSKYVSDRYGYYYCKTLKSWMESEASATTIAILNKGRFSKAPFLLAPLNEQKRIADKLDTLLAAVNSCRARLDKVPTLIKRFRQSVLAAAITGSLTEDWRKGAEFQTFEIEFSELIQDSIVGLVRSAAEQYKLANETTPYLKMNNISENWGYSLDSLVGVQCSQVEREKFQLKKGDWLFNTRNSMELVGKSCVWQGEPAIFNNNILRVRFKKSVLSEYVEIWFRSPLGRQRLEQVKSATTSVAAIYQRSLLAQKLSLPTLTEQFEIVRRVDALFAIADKLETSLATVSKRVDQLTPAILAKAFRGELVAQDPSDEPASSLLARLATL